MREWTKELRRRVFRQRDTEGTQPVSLLGVEPATITSSEVGAINVDGWLEEKAQELNGDWSLARLSSFSRGEGALARQMAAAMLKPTEELSLELAPDELYSERAIRVRTLEGTVVGYIESSVAETVSRQLMEGDLIRCFVYRVALNEQRFPPSVLLALMSWTFSPALTSRHC